MFPQVVAASNRWENMRVTRWCALGASVALVAATSVSMINHRSDSRSEQDARVTAAVLVADQSVQSTLARAVAVVQLTDDLTNPAEKQAPMLVVDESTDSILVVSRDVVTSALRLSVSALIDAQAAAIISRFDADVAVVLSAIPAESVEPFGPLTDAGRRTVTDIVALPGDAGSVRLVASIPDEVGLIGDEFVPSLALLLLGAVLTAMVGWTLLLERRALERRAATDDLTGLANRREFERIATESLLTAERCATGACLMLIDLNGFKQINDTFGHQFGDLVLEAAAKRLLSAVRDTDVVGRWGGDEFVVLLPGVDDGVGVRTGAERISQALAAEPLIGNVTVTAAIGAALFPRHGSEFDDLISAADLAMYSAKSTGATHRLADVHAIGFAAQQQRSEGRYEGIDRCRHFCEADAATRD
jgi:diguanylate cyclase (GGDEF)-like protein